MKPGFALSLSPDGISLLHRAAGGWRLVGSVELSSADLGADLTELRKRAERLEPEPISCKLIIPNDQIRFLTIETGLASFDTRLDMARAALDGATPYKVDELAFDLSQDGPMTHVAAVAIETLDEAETFASEYGFGPTSFVAAPGDMGFLGEPFFGTARAVRGREIEPDGIAVVDIGPAVIPAAAPAAPAKSTPVSETADPAPSNGASVTLSEGTDFSDADPAPIIGFSSRRGKPGATAPLLQGASRSDIPAAPPGSKTSTPAENLVKPDHVSSDNENIDQSSGIIPQPELPPSNADHAPPAVQISAPTVIDSGSEVTEPDEADRADQTAFSSRRQPEPVAKKPSRLSRRVITRKSASAKTATPADLSNSPFSMRDPIDVGGKPRFLGIALIAALLLFMAVVARAYKDGGLFSFGNSPEELVDTPLVASTETVEEPTATDSVSPVSVPVPAIEQEQLPEILQPQVSALPESISVLAEPPITDPSEAPTLTETDSAVLDALRAPSLSDLDPEAVSDGVADTESTPLPELSLAAQYAATGVWQTTPDVPAPPALIGLDDLYVASIDNTDLSQDAVALPTSCNIPNGRWSFI